MADDAEEANITGNTGEEDLKRKDKLRKAIRYTVCFDLGVGFVFFCICMTWVHEFFTMDSTRINGALVALPPYGQSTSTTAGLTLAAGLIDFLVRLFLVVLMFIATSKSYLEKRPTRCAYMIETSLGLYICLEMGEVAWFFNFTKPTIDENENEGFNKFIFACEPVYSLLFLIALCKIACTFLRYLPTVFVTPPVGPGLIRAKPKPAQMATANSALVEAQPEPSSKEMTEANLTFPE